MINNATGCLLARMSALYKRPKQTYILKSQSNYIQADLISQRYLFSYSELKDYLVALLAICFPLWSIHVSITVPKLSYFVDHFKTNFPIIVSSLGLKIPFTNFDFIFHSLATYLQAELFFLITSCFILLEILTVIHLILKSKIQMRVTLLIPLIVYWILIASLFPEPKYEVSHFIFPSHL